MEQLANVGLIAMLEARAKSLVEAALKGLETLDESGWKALERQQFAQLQIRIETAASKLGDAKLADNVSRLATLRQDAQSARHMVVHGNWGIGASGEPNAYDVRRGVWLTDDDIRHAVDKAVALCNSAHACVYRVAELIAVGTLPEGQPGPGVSMRTADRLVKL